MHPIRLPHDAIGWLMLVCGVLTFTMVSALIAPDWALREAFGDTVTEPLALAIVRSWGALVALVGAFTIVGALRPQWRTPALAISAVSKAVFVAVMLTSASAAQIDAAAVVLLIDTAWALLFGGALLRELRQWARASAYMRVDVHRAV